MASLKAKLFTQASVFPALTALLGTNPFRWFDEQLPQSATFPAIVVFLIDDPSDYVIGGEMSTSWQMLQFTVYGTGNDSVNASLVVAALKSFLRVFNAYSSRPLPAYANRVTGNRDGGIADTQPLTYQRFVTAKILNDENM